ncbi:MAG: DUF1592 domain-containing protein [Planctomycetes bacterium]|nr:DUF1592 domain-containing protein [Planctomycetota bacterium]
MTKQVSVRALAILGLLTLPVPSRAADPFREQLQPFLKAYCYECHNSTKSEGELNLARYDSTAMLAEDFRQWEHVVTFLKSREMPPGEAMQPTDSERAKFLQLLNDVMLTEARKLAGDPGVVLPRRLSNAEYNYTIRDLTGVDIRPADSFPVDPASGEGFSNTGEALLMSPSLFKKYYAAAQFVADHIDFTPSGWAFAPYPVSTYADQKKLHEQLILDFYSKHDVKYETYLNAAWSYRCRPAGSTVTLEAWAGDRELSPRYLRSLWELISGDPSQARFYVKELRQRWQSIPADSSLTTPPPEIRTLARDLQQLSRRLTPTEIPAIVANAGNGPITHIEHRRKMANSRDTFNTALLSDSRRFHIEFRDLAKQDSIQIVLHAAACEGDPNSGFVVLKDLNLSTSNPDAYRPNDDKKNASLLELLKTKVPDQYERLHVDQQPLGLLDSGSIGLPVGKTVELTIPKSALPDTRPVHLYVEARLDRDHSPSGLAQFALLDHTPDGNSFEDAQFPLVNPEHAVAAELQQSCQSLCQILPSRFYFADEERGLSAGFHLIEGFFRDDQPLCKHVLNDTENRELDRLWDELEFGTQIAEKMLRGFVFFERSERDFMKHPDFDSFKEEDPELTTQDSVLRLEQAYLKRTNFKGSAEQLAAHPIHLFFEDIRQGLKQRGEKLAQAQPVYLQLLEAFAQSAYRRPLTDTETQQLRAFFHKLSGQAESGIEMAVRASVIRLLVSPHFCYRIDPAPAGDSVQPLSDLALASRLSYFLWSSQPDAELLSVAVAGKLSDDEVLRAQTRRMLKDPRVSGFAREFFGQWLRYRDFLEQESVSRDSFPAFDAALKQAMFEEPSRLTASLIQHDRPVTDLLNGDVTVVNKRLAQHYGIPFAGSDSDWSEVTGLHQQGRSGLLGMAVFLTRNSQPQRTSPVKRGFWVVHHLLGEHIPAPPADVVALPARETDTNGKTIRQLLALHTEDVKCARCHVRFDAVGLSMEGFDAIGRARTRDLAGRAVDNLVPLPSGKEARGVPEYSQYLVAERADEFTKTLSRKFVGFALGRSLQLSDQPLLETMQSRLKENDQRFGILFETVVTSPQFRNQRCRDFSAAAFKTEVSGD